MAIQSIDTDGNITWACPHWPEDAERACGTSYQHHISHEAIQWSGAGKPEHQQTVSLPPCSVCGSQTFLKVHFTERELMAPNMWQVWNDWHDEQLGKLVQAYQSEQGDETNKNVMAQQIQALRQAKQQNGYHLPSHAMALRHIETASQLKASGKVPVAE